MMVYQPSADSALHIYAQLAKLIRKLASRTIGLNFLDELYILAKHKKTVLCLLPSDLAEENTTQG
jgi:hypothetical protein